MGQRAHDETAQRGHPTGAGEEETHMDDDTERRRQSRPGHSWHYTNFRKKNTHTHTDTHKHIKDGTTQRDRTQLDSGAVFLTAVLKVRVR